MAAWMLVSGAQAFFGLASPTVTSLPFPLPHVWAALILGGGVHISIGLRLHSYAELVASGLSILGYVLSAYAVAIVIYAPDLRRAATVMGLLFAIAAVCWSRAWWLRARDDLLIKELGNGAEDDG